MKRTHAKLIDAGFTVLRTGETNKPVIKKCVPSGGLGDTTWVVMERCDTKAARDRRMAELLEDPMVISDSLDYDAHPYWDDELGVVLPGIRKRLFPKSLGEMAWEPAMKAAKDAGGALPEKREAYHLLYWKDEINKLLQEHGGDILKGWTWTSLEYSAAVAWNVGFSTGILNGSSKCNTFQVRALAAY